MYFNTLQDVMLHNYVFVNTANSPPIQTGKDYMQRLSSTL